jgi:hypothetical protein
MMTEDLKTEIQAYESMKNRLVAEGHVGKFALLAKSSLVGLWDTYEDALQAGYQNFGLAERFLVKKVEGIEGIQFFSRDITCQASRSC